MKFGFILPNNWGIADPVAVANVGVEAEEFGLESVWVNHHIVNAGYIADRLGNRPYHDALTVLTWVASQTSTIKLGTSVLVMPYLHPMATAKALATLDLMIFSDRSEGATVIAAEALKKIMVNCGVMHKS